MYERIVVGLDGSELSEGALRTGANLAKALNVPLHLVRVADLATVHWGATEASDSYAALSQEMEREKAEAAAYLEKDAAPLRDEGLNVSTEVRPTSWSSSRPTAATAWSASSWAPSPKRSPARRLARC
jgi:nucleotide-binding universal stress UspA family protein